MSQASDYAARASSILQNKANAIAEGKVRSGQILGNTIATLGQVIPQQVQDVMKRNAEKRKQEQLLGIFHKHGGDLPAAISEVMAIDPDLGLDLTKRYQEAATAAYNYKTAQWKAKKDEIDTLGNLIGSAKDQDSYTQALVTAKMMGLDLSNVPQEYSPQIVDQYNRAHLTALQRLELDKPKPPEPFTLTPGSKRFDASGKEIAAVPYELTPDQQADNARMAQAEERQAAAQSETVRHNQAMERINLMQEGRAQAAAAEAARHNRATEAEAAKSGAGGAKLSAAAVTSLAGIDQSLGVMDSLERLKKDEWLGPIAGRVSGARVSTPGVQVSDELARFTAETATLKNSIVKAITGAQMSEPEAARIMKQIPDLTDKPNVWKEKLAATRDNLKTLKRRTIELSGGTDTPTAPPSVPKPGGKIGPYSFTVE